MHFFYFFTCTLKWAFDYIIKWTRWAQQNHCPHFFPNLFSCAQKWELRYLMKWNGWAQQNHVPLWFGHFIPLELCYSGYVRLVMNHSRRLILCAWLLGSKAWLALDTWRINRPAQPLSTSRTGQASRVWIRVEPSEGICPAQIYKRSVIWHIFYYTKYCSNLVGHWSIFMLGLSLVVASACDISPDSSKLALSAFPRVLPVTSSISPKSSYIVISLTEKRLILSAPSVMT